MPLISEEPQIPESAQGPRVTPAAGRTAPTPRPVPGPRSAATPRPGRPGPGPARPAPPAQRAHPAPAAPAAPAPAPAAPARPEPTENRSAPQIQLIPAPAAGALDAAEEAVDLLLESGRAPGDILVLTTGEQHPWAAHELSFGEAAYWAQHDAGDDVFFADVSAADRARSRPVVVVAVNDDADQTVAARTLPVVRDRAAALLIVCGDPQMINSALGAGV
ncbi:hypothetical protein [Streptomyces anulatus]|uniref:hypothetical protein n=1 Tax=Streptomyces anulatus TaxID=1892 RepID=UPI00386384ED|nr:hypothetical protein OG575_10120 [Streptomyces anulatus]